MTTDISQKGREVLTQTERQLQLVLQAMAEQYLDMKEKIETKIVGNLYEYSVELFVTSQVVEVVAFEAETRELFAFARYEKTERQLLYSLRYDVLHGCIRDIVLYDRMEGYET